MGCSCSYAFGIVALNLLIIAQPTLLEKKLIGIVLLNPNPWLIGTAIIKEYGSNATGWTRAGLAFFIVLIVSTVFLYWLSGILYITVHGFQFPALYG